MRGVCGAFVLCPRGTLSSKVALESWPSAMTKALLWKTLRRANKVYATSSTLVWVITVAVAEIFAASDIGSCAENGSTTSLCGSDGGLCELPSSSDDDTFSSMQCAFAPPYPNEFTLALLNLPCGHGVSCVTTLTLAASKSTIRIS
jgi:hypothetical protein